MRLEGDSKQGQLCGLLSLMEQRLDRELAEDTNALDLTTGKERSVSRTLECYFPSGAAGSLPAGVGGNLLGH